MVNSLCKIITTGSYILASIPFFLGSCEAAPLPDCPPTILVSETILSNPNGWDKAPYTGNQRLVRITFKLHSDPGELRPDEEYNQNGNQILIWNVEGMKELEQICTYTGTLVRLSRPVKGTVSHCKVQVTKSSGASPGISAECQ